MPDFLGMLAEEEERALRARGITRRFRRGAILLREGEEPTRVLVLTDGRTKAVTFTDDGKEVILGVMGPGSLLGEVATIQNRPRSATVTALEPCEAIALASGDFWALLEEHPRIWIAVHKVVIGRLRLADLQRKEFSGSNTLSRVSRRLVELTNEHGRQEDDGVTITLPLTQEELAGWTGASREAVAKTFQALRGLGWVSTGRRSVVLHDLDALRDRAG